MVFICNISDDESYNWKRTVLVNLSCDGFSKVWQNGVLVSHANIKEIEKKLAQAHFGLYCPPIIETKIVYNDDLTIKGVANE